MQVFLIVHHAPLVRQLAHIICNSNSDVSADQQSSLVPVNCCSLLLVKATVQAAVGNAQVFGHEPSVT